MTLKENLLEELQKLRLARERPLISQAKKGSKESKQLEEAKRLLEEVKED